MGRFLDLIGWPSLPAQESRASIENPAVSLSSAQAWASMFSSWNSGSATGAKVTVESALGVPSVWAAVSFLSRTMATLPLHAYRVTAAGPVKIKGGLQTLIHDAPNAEWTSYDWREYLFWQTFTEGRGLSWIERVGNNIVGIWPMETAKATVEMRSGRRLYRYNDGGADKVYPAGDVIDVPFSLRPDQLGAYSPIDKCRNAIGLAIAMESYAGKFFKGGGIPPLALVGPLPQGAEGMKRAMADMNRAVDNANSTEKPILPMPAGHELKPIGVDPDKGQMTDARRMQIEEIARAYQLPPVFLQDLTRATFSNAEQQDLHLVKHLVGQWAKRFEQQLNLKLFGQRNGNRYIEHNLDGLMRGDFKSRSEALARSIQAGYRTPQEARRIENLADHPNPEADNLYMQGATVPLGTVLNPPIPAPKENGGEDDPEA